jgi:uncharacterized membrane protein
MATTELVQQPSPAPRGLQERASDVITAFCGDMKFVYLHGAFFVLWIATKGFGNDHFPFNFLTMAVSLEAIFLSTFILISQNRQQAIARRQQQAGAGAAAADAARRRDGREAGPEERRHARRAAQPHRR